MRKPLKGFIFSSFLEFSNAGEDTIGEISCEWRSKITETCSVCEKDFDGETTTCKSCGKVG